MPATNSTIGTALLSIDPSPVAADSEVLRVRQSRIAYQRDGCLEGFACLAAPVGPQRRHDAVSVFGAAHRIDQNDQVRVPLQNAASVIWQRLNARSTPLVSTRVSA